MLKKFKFKIFGTHCSSCKDLIETEVDTLFGVKNINVDYSSGETIVEYDSEKISKEKIFKVIKKLKYEPREIGSDFKANKLGIKKIISIGVLFILFVGAYFIVSELGLLEIMSSLNETSISLWLVLLIGFLASFHCVGMCGGLVISYSAKVQTHEKNYLSHLRYNLGRFISYSIIGGILGGFGSFFGVNPTFTGGLVLVAGVFMILLGISLFSNIRWIEKIKLKTPKFIARFLYNNKNTKKPKGSFLVGLLNGFMPCGPLQAMQVYALTTGSIMDGAIAMGVYAIGTIPLMFGFGNIISSIQKSNIKKIMKVSGLIVVILGFIMLNRGLLQFGVGFNSFLPESSKSKTEYVATGDAPEYQVINMDLTYRGYSPNVLYIKKSIPVRWLINVKEMSGCTNAIMIESLGIKKDLKMGMNIIEFTAPANSKEIKFSCWMKMVWGKFIVTGDGNAPMSKSFGE